MGFLQATDRASRSWTKLIRADLEWLDANEPGPSQLFGDLVSKMVNAPAHQWRSRVKQVKTACLLVQATKDDIDIFNTYQQDAYGMVSISIGPQEAPTEWLCHKCHSLALLPPNRVSDSTSPPLTPSTMLPTFSPKHSLPSMQEEDPLQVSLAPTPHHHFLP